jgi:DNA-binding PadR family transcriptional regulator
MSLFELTGFQRDLLYVIVSLDIPSGQFIRENIEQSTDTDVNHGRLYPNLDTLVDNGLVERGDLDRRTNYYQLTEFGVQALKDRREWENRLWKE